MLGGHISIFHQADGGANPAISTSPRGMRISVCQSYVYGLEWINKLVSEGKAINLGGDGYPVQYTAKSEKLIQHILSGPPAAREVWMFDFGDILT